MKLVRCYRNRHATEHIANALVDDEDFERVNAYRWYVRPLNLATAELGAAFAQVDGQQIAMARFIVGLRKGDTQVVHHRNEYKLDNRRANLHVCRDQISHLMQPHPKRDRRIQQGGLRHWRLRREAEAA